MRVVSLTRDSLSKHFQTLTVDKVYQVHVKAREFEKMGAASLVYIEIDGRFKILKNRDGNIGVVDKESLDREIAKTGKGK